MAVLVTDNRTILYQDGLTNITGASTSVTNFFAESTGSAGEAYNIATGQIYWSGTTPNFTVTGNELIYVWSAVVATQNGYKEVTPSDSSHAMYLSDGTNDLVIYQAGNDRDVFKHADTQVSFQCFVIDIDYLSTANTNGDLAAIGGSFAGFNSASTSMDVGAHYTTLSKALGGGQNCYMDIIRYGGADDGIQITGGTTGDRGTYAEVAAEDRSTADGKAHGILREYTSGAYGVQGTLRHGSTATASTYFEETGFTMTFEDRLISSDKYKLVVEANSTGTNVYNITGATISSARPAVTVDMSSSNINSLQINQCTFSDLINPVSFPTDTNGTTLDHDVADSVFSNCGQIDPGSVVFSGNRISNSSNTTTGAVLLDSDGSTNWSNLRFVSGGTGHAIYITTTGTYVFNGITYSGYASVDGSTGNEVVYNNSGGAVTINVSNGDTPTVRNGAGASTTINNNVSVTLTGLPNNVEVRVYENSGSGVAGADIAGTENVTGNQFQFTDGAGSNVIITIFDEEYEPRRILYTVPSTSTTIPIELISDGVYLNP